MGTMKLNYNEKELYQLLQDFHDLTRLTLTLYDPEGEWIFSYPTKENLFLQLYQNLTGRSRPL